VALGKLLAGRGKPGCLGSPSAACVNRSHSTSHQLKVWESRKREGEGEAMKRVGGGAGGGQGHGFQGGPESLYARHGGRREFDDRPGRDGGAVEARRSPVRAGRPVRGGFPGQSQGRGEGFRSFQQRDSVWQEKTWNRRGVETQQRGVKIGLDSGSQHGGGEVSLEVARRERVEGMEEVSGGGKCLRCLKKGMWRPSVRWSCIV
jgi:hypothetical protein